MLYPELATEEDEEAVKEGMKQEEDKVNCEVGFGWTATFWTTRRLLVADCSDCGCCKYLGDVAVEAERAMGRELKERNGGIARYAED